jgi:AP-3 complex subunit beta
VPRRYCRDADKTFVAQTIQSIGRCASQLPSVTESCLAGLMSLLHTPDESVVAESVVVIKKLLQLNPAAHTEIIVLMAKMATDIKVPMARASILWLIGLCAVDCVGGFL